MTANDPKRTFGASSSGHPAMHLFKSRFLSQDLIVAAMFTQDFQSRADRLVQSLDQLKLSYAIYKVPTVHISISTRGTSDVNYSKPIFISHCLDRFKCPILYVDSDVVFRAWPQRIYDASLANSDFAIYNWLADEQNDAYVPMAIESRQRVVKNHVYRFSHRIDIFDESQLICSGAVQYYSPSEPAKALLKGWLDVLKQYPGVADDELLDYAFNASRNKIRLNRVWLDKSYCRYPWWIHVRPVIDHPDFPARSRPDRHFKAVVGSDRFDTSFATHNKESEAIFPHQYLIDTKEKKLVKIRGDELVPVKEFTNELYLSDAESNPPLVRLPLRRNDACYCGSGVRFKRCHGSE